MTILILALVLAGSGRFYFLGKNSQNQEVQLGLVDNKLKVCPDKPNCVSSFASDEHFIEPIKTTKSFNEIKEILLLDKNAKLIKSEDQYLHLTYTSSLFKFTDDLELFFLYNKLHVRSSSRVGYSDLGANRKRVEYIRSLLEN